MHLVVSKTNIFNSQFTRINDIYSTVFPHYGIAELFLKAGFHVDATNYSLETPLHIVSLHQNFDNKIVQLLLRHGAHIDQKDLTGNQPCRRLVVISRCKINPLRYTTLKCLASIKVRLYNLKYKGLVPIEIENFIDLH